ncbi:MAG TPA: GAF domain-containing protein, partial [Vineibacter sp.]|nr:GAF domain-containing protein [Vineibacter sp.]
MARRAQSGRKAAAPPPPAADLAGDNARLARELAEARGQQAATSEILQAIARSPTDLQAVLDAVVRNAARLCEADNASLLRVEGDAMRRVASHGTVRTSLRVGEARPISRRSLSGRAILDRAVIDIPDYFALDLAREYPDIKAAVERDSIRSCLAVPLLRDGVAIGALTIYRTEVRPFSERHAALVRTFADQAVIAIENVRLFNETREALDRQTAMSDVLRIISMSPTDLRPVLEAIARNAARLCAVDHAHIWGRDGEQLRHLATSGEIQPFQQLPVSRGSVVGRALLDRVPVHVEDLAAVFATEFPDATGLMQRGARTALAMPLLREGEAIGVIVVRRTEVRPFTEAQIALLRAFADQAVIAIENTRLFSELQARTSELSESLDQQTATSEVLKAISHSVFDVGPVFEAVVENAVKLCQAERACLFRFDGKLLRAAAAYNLSPALRAWVDQNPIALGRQSISARAALERRTVHVPDVQADRDYAYALKDVDPIRTILAVPMLKGDELVGTITLYKLAVSPFTDKQIDLVETFAAQAVIAIENA